MTATMQTPMMPYSVATLPLKHKHCETQTHVMQNAIPPSVNVLFLVRGEFIAGSWQAN